VSLLREMELLLPWLAVMELKRRGMLGEAAHRASTARLFDEKALYRPPSVSHGSRAAFKASVSAIGP
jgi:hypothetical protein